MSTTSDSEIRPCPAGPTGSAANERIHHRTIQKLALRIELRTSSLPRTRSTTELCQRLDLLPVTPVATSSRPQQHAEARPMQRIRVASGRRSISLPPHLSNAHPIPISERPASSTSFWGHHVAPFTGTRQHLSGGPNASRTGILERKTPAWKHPSRSLKKHSRLQLQDYTHCCKASIDG